MGENRPRMENHEPSANGRCANGSRFGVGGVVPAAGLGFGERVRGVVNGLCHGLTDGNGCTARKWESLRSGWACLLRQAQHNACGGFWVSAGVSVGWSTDSATDSWTGTDGRRANGSRFGLGGLVCFDRLSTTPAADSGFRRARLCALVDFDVK